MLILSAILIFCLSLTACHDFENPLYPFKRNPYYDFYGRWKYVEPGAPWWSTLTISKDRLIYYTTEDGWLCDCTIINWEPYSYDGNVWFTSGCHLTITSNDTNFVDVYILIDNSKKRLVWDWQENNLNYSSATTIYDIPYFLKQ